MEYENRFACKQLGKFTKFVNDLFFEIKVIGLRKYVYFNKYSKKNLS